MTSVSGVSGTRSSDATGGFFSAGGWRCWRRLRRTDRQNVIEQLRVPRRRRLPDHVDQRRVLLLHRVPRRFEPHPLGDHPLCRLLHDRRLHHKHHLQLADVLTGTSRPLVSFETFRDGLWELAWPACGATRVDPDDCCPRRCGAGRRQVHLPRCRYLPWRRRAAWRVRVQTHPALGWTWNGRR